MCNIEDLTLTVFFFWFCLIAVLKILSVSDNSAEEIVNLKTVGIRNNFAGSMDVKWGPTTGACKITVTAEPK